MLSIESSDWADVFAGEDGLQLESLHGSRGTRLSSTRPSSFGPVLALQRQQLSTGRKVRNIEKLYFFGQQKNTERRGGKIKKYTKDTKIRFPKKDKRRGTFSQFLAQPL